MGGRRRSNGGDGRNHTSLSRRVEQAIDKHGCKTLDDVIGYLRSSYADYSRVKQQPFESNVDRAFNKLRRRKRIPQEEEEEIGGSEPRNRKRRRLIDRSGEKLMRLEDTQSTLESGSESNCVDLMKSTLRESYGASAERNLEAEEIRKGGFLKSDVPVEEVRGPRFSDLGGMEETIDELNLLIATLYQWKTLRSRNNVKLVSGILLHGPPGCGKTKLAHAIANEIGANFYPISATEVVSGVSGESEEYIRELFLKAEKTGPSIIFIDEFDAIASKRENMQRVMEGRIVSQLLTCMDAFHKRPLSVDKKSNTINDNLPSDYVLVIAATNRPDAIDQALRRPGRFDKELEVKAPDENARLEILSILKRDLRLEGDFDLVKIARATPGFVGADLSLLMNMAFTLALRRIFTLRKLELSKRPMESESQDWRKRPLSDEEMERFSVTMSDLEEAAKRVQPSLKREGFSTIPNVKWEDVGGLKALRHQFERHIVNRIKDPGGYEEFRIKSRTGILLYGPPGCGKTLIATAVASEAGASFIHVQGPELLNKYVGESELAVRTLFNCARACAPCIIFFDEIDSLTTKQGNEGGVVGERVVTQLQTELDGAQKREGVYVIGATNRPEMIQDAILRPGRLGTHLYVPLPTPDERGSILQALAREKPLDESVDLLAIAKNPACENFSGADLDALLEEASITAYEDSRETGSSCTIKPKHFEQSLCIVTPSVSKEQREHYDRLYRTFGSRKTDS